MKQSQTITPPALSHQVLLGKEPTPRQMKLYESFPETRGVSDANEDAEVMEALIVLAMTFGTAGDRVYLFAPRPLESWVIAQFNRACDVIFGNCKQLPNGSAIARGYGMLFQKISLTTRADQFPEAPERWLSFGLTQDSAAVPSWLKTQLDRHSSP